MRVLIQDSYYGEFLSTFYSRSTDIAREPYETQRRRLIGERFGTSDFYATGLARCGINAVEIITNCDVLQRSWAREHAPHLWAAYPLYQYSGRLIRWRRAVIEAQIKWYKPDVLFIQDLSWTYPVLLRDGRPQVSLIICNHAAKLPGPEAFRACDLVVSSLPNIVQHVRQQGGKAELLRLGFGVDALAEIGEVDRTRDVVHVGGYGGIHAERDALLEQVARKVACDFWGYGIDRLGPSSPIRSAYRGEAWGLEMYRVRASSRLTLTRHITSVAGPYANNCTLYEATGIGSCLVVDRKDNLSDMFVPDEEVVSYSSPEECIEKVTYLLDHEDQRSAIARAGQKRCLQEHTYHHRMAELTDILRCNFP